MWMLALVAAFGLGTVAFAQDEKKDTPKQDEKKPDEKKPEEKKQDGPAAPPFSFPASADLKTKCGFDDEQAKKVEALYADYSTKAADTQKKLDGGDKKAKKELSGIRSDLVTKLHDVCKDDEQKKKLDEALPAAKKKKDKA
jgi:hypothetical protein